MKKKFLLLMVLLLCIGCTRIDNDNYDAIIDDVISNNINIYNTMEPILEISTDIIHLHQKALIN